MSHSNVIKIARDHTVKSLANSEYVVYKGRERTLYKHREIDRFIITRITLRNKYSRERENNTIVYMIKRARSHICMYDSRLLYSNVYQSSQSQTNPASVESRVAVTLLWN